MGRGAPWGWILAGGVALKVLTDKSAQNDGEESLNTLDSLAAGAENLVKTITGTKEPDFITKMAPIAAQIRLVHGIDPLITISQAALESGWGLSGLTKKANNLFGFTGDSWAAQGKSVIYMETSEYSPLPPEKLAYWSKPGDIVSKKPSSRGGTDLRVKRPFRSYPTWYDSVADWAQLMKNSRYAAAYKAAQSGDIDGFAVQVQKAGYATDPDYAGELIAVGHRVSDVQNA